MQIARLREGTGALEHEYDLLLGSVQTEATRLPSVAEAEEALAAAQVELERVQRLGETLSHTQKFLQRAQERVHRDIAPVLTQAICERLSRVTGGRYPEVRVDPKDLTVRVRLADGTLQPAQLLSHGTAEQVYLLLRVAMAERLTTPGEVCPLILDDVTVQSDAERTVAILDALHALSLERQIILFSQEEEVLRWAKISLTDGSCDRLQEFLVTSVPA